ncbi:hypothetical protein GALL_136150 [mine drainage metagenome]|uniref:DUF362 domain-containing protein n=1 Tax=mine drainage metagenome TaxID=410659 RepID=A0A1J5S7Y1_9ZZZZ
MHSRRDFLRTGLALGAAACVLPEISSLFAAEPAVPDTPAGKPLLSAVRDGTRSAMLERALADFGGIQAFVKPGHSVLVKPNIGWNTPPERGADTHPELVGHLVALCKAAGANRVAVFDRTCDKWTDCYARSGIADAVKAAGGEMVPGNDEDYYREVELPQGRILKSAKVHRLVLESDVFFNVPVLKNHQGSLLTASMKNLMGIVWDRGFYHRADLHQCIADFLTYKRPDLNILDAYHPMYRNGPRGRTVADVVEKRMLFASRDIVAIDAAGAKVLEYDPAKVRHIALAGEMGLGVMDLARVDIRRHALV